MAHEEIGKASQPQSNVDDEADIISTPLIPRQLHPTEPLLVNDAESDFFNCSFNEFLPLPWHDRADLHMQVVNEPTLVETSIRTKSTLIKACKAFGINAIGFEHDILGIILRIEERRKMQLQLHKKSSLSLKKGKSKDEIELNKFEWGLQEGTTRKVRGKSQKAHFR